MLSFLDSMNKTDNALKNVGNEDKENSAIFSNNVSAP